VDLGLPVPLGGLGVRSTVDLAVPKSKSNAFSKTLS